MEVSKSIGRHLRSILTLSSRHMDKHDRRYKCTNSTCEKLQGFSNSGGLLRHEREVHKMHGAAKKSFFCPYENCIRSSGDGFTRKENLNTHIINAHISDSCRTLKHRANDESVKGNTKRKRDWEDSDFSDRSCEDMWKEINRLTEENKAMELKLEQLEKAVTALQQQVEK
jgi:hypothetical protein